MIEHWRQILPVPNTVKLHSIKRPGPDKLKISSVTNGEVFGIIIILPAQMRP